MLKNIPVELYRSVQICLTKSERNVMEDIRLKYEKAFPNFINYEPFWLVWQEAWKQSQKQLEQEMISYAALLEREIYNENIQ